MDRHIFNEKSATKSKPLREYSYDGVIPDSIKFEAYNPTKSTLYQESIPNHRITKLKVYSKRNSYRVFRNDSYEPDRICWSISPELTIKTSIRNRNLLFTPNRAKPHLKDYH